MYPMRPCSAPCPRLRINLEAMKACGTQRRSEREWGACMKATTSTVGSSFDELCHRQVSTQEDSLTGKGGFFARLWGLALTGSPNCQSYQQQSDGKLLRSFFGLNCKGRRRATLPVTGWGRAEEVVQRISITLYTLIIIPGRISWALKESKGTWLSLFLYFV